jgi:DNA-binding transcriptional LysR family regulator
MKLNDIDLNKLSTFLAVVEAGGITRAARALGRTASAVSQSVSALEASLGCQLFDRVGKSLVLTRGGQALSASVEGYQALLERALGELAGAGVEVSGLVRLGLFLGFPRDKSRALLVAFAERFPEASLRVVYAPQHDLETRLRKNALDYVLSFRPRSAEAADLVSTRLFEQELVLVSGPRFFARGFSLEALAQAPIVDYYQSDPLIRRWLAHHFPARAVTPRVRFWAATTDLVLELVQSGAGVGVLPRHMVRGRAFQARATARAAAAARLRLVGPAGQPLIDHVWLNEPRAAYRDATQRAFREVVLSVLAAPAPGARPRRT